MANSVLIASAQFSERKKLGKIATPEGTWSHQPIPHLKAVDMVAQSLESQKLTIVGEKYSVNEDGSRMFGVLDIKGKPLKGIPEYHLAVGIRNSHDKSLRFGVCLGARVLVCTNLCFHGEAVIQVKHTTWASEKFPALMQETVRKALSYRDAQAKSYLEWSQRDMDDKDARFYFVELARNGVIPKAQLLDVVEDWEHPTHDEFSERNLFSAFNCVTESLKERNQFSLPDFSQTLVKVTAGMLN